MKRIALLLVLIISSMASYGQYRWEVTGGLLRSKMDHQNVETVFSNGFYLNAGYGYMLDNRARSSIVFSFELLQRNSKITESNTGLGVAYGDQFQALQVGFSPKFRYFIGGEEFRVFANVGPSFRVNTGFEIGDQKLESDQYEQIIISGVYGVGASWGIGEMVDVMAEAGITNDFVDNLVDVESKFFDYYARIGIRFRIYDATR
ncbi:outer membrane beta-barrel protein [Aquimarina hainanensis]|uniref:Outer membrane beta-barrel protein n=1 Tax=Aquimarina hainanensis TaxID=1578017 RepID=A0ABW5NE37_9FLAO|nr:outer membrane beta-barrel protein [Aquimarina sp. TRL1]QKX06409.1 hypothetical protein HN014_16320 [Aquimarina sp. TRL1]